MPSQVTEMPGRVPMEIVALRIATPAHWVTVLYPHLVQGSSLAGQMIEAAGGFDTDEFVYGRFRHVGSVLNPKSRERICSSGEYDGLMHAMLSRNRLAAATQLLELDQWPLEGDEKVQTFLKLRREMAELQVHYEDLAALRRNSPGDAPFPYDSRAAELALALAHRGEWPVHLFLMSFMTPRSQWHDRAVVERIAAHKNPVSLRFLDKRGLALTESTHMKS